MQGAQANSKVDFLILSDCLETGVFADNMKICRWSLEDVRRLAESKLQTDVVLEKPFKLCDLKPMYGHIFEECSTGYDFWGYGDIDVLYGDLQHWLLEAERASADIISFRQGWLTGSLCFVRNSDAMRKLYAQAPRWRDAVREKEYVLFDELGSLSFGARRKGASFDEIRAPYGSFSEIAYLAESRGQIKLYAVDAICESLGKRGLLVRSAAGIRDLRRRSEYAYYHMVIDKRRFFTCVEDVEPPVEYYITPTGMYDVAEYGSIRQRITAAKRFVVGARKCGLRYLRRRIRWTGARCN